ncbi:cytochrome b [Chitinimonas sp. BJB300]|uniref:cytochrome b n=1 Tax=Chitinimonas sp. BJB300 TaxID=1559339 RepID=UPI000C0C5F6E|nr:cytochrome bc complex cytochrome b subunit [Chitinimonas sp. BJB300]PHV11286.1 cytochrome b [Chitinimonas sp. BJB300]TSJ91557.1 cytochrome bc complex cytochrome b subunit [Chitinimonas sp. BJB300]
MSKLQALAGNVMNWVDDRFPATKMYKEHLSEYYAPKNFNFWYYFGSLALLVLVIQIVTGIFLTMNYKPDGSLIPGTNVSVAFMSVEYIMRDVAGGWLIRYMHSTGASMFFVVVYLHMFRGLVYGSYKQPRELIWIFGMMIFLCLMAEAFLGYLLPWGQMSFWGAQVIVNLFASIPVIGPDLSVWIRGDFVVSDATLNRFFALHVIAVPLVLLALVVAHLVALHEVGSNNPDGVEIKKNKDPKTGIPLDGIPFHPYYTVKDIFGVAVFLAIFSYVLFFVPEMGGFFLEHPNFDPADPLKTPPHIAPVWYFTPYYAILRAIPSFLGTQVWGVIGMGAAVMIIALLPWLDRSPVKSIRYRGPKFKVALVLFLIAFICLGILGAKPSTNLRTILAQGFSFIYFGFFILMPFYTKNDVGSTPVPARTTESNTQRQLAFLAYTALAIVGSFVFGKLV